MRHKRIGTNPVRDAQTPRQAILPVDERALPELDEIEAIARSIGQRLEPAIWLMACRGLRIGEVLGLHEEDFEGNFIRLRRQVVRTKARGDGAYVVRYAPLKHREEGEWRDIPLGDSVAGLARAFPVLSETGTMLYPDLLRRSWNRAVKRLGLPAYTPHDLRHEWATVTLTKGVSIHEVSRWLGHTSIKVTVDRYGHLTQDGQERCQRVVDEAYAGLLEERVSSGRTAEAPRADLVPG